MQNMTLDSAYDGIYQDNPVVSNIQDLIDQEEWEDGELVPQENLNVFIFPGQGDAQA